ncbi:MAG: tyrosine-type recombinase/integrase, partial [Cyclobacteriaceae bacterium]|nr:tyrosine-type recombinase/integrase [Cyclobacteriaceae bacterium]
EKYKDKVFHVISNTHWDREWRYPFQRNRQMLVDMIDKVLEILDSEPEYRAFHLDSQSIVIKDYLEIRNREVDPGNHGFLFVTNTGAPCYPMMVYRIVNHYLNDHTSTEKKSPHVLRHTYATHLLNKGAEINAVKDLLGHSSLAATQVYTHNSMEKIKKAYDQAHPKA